MEDRLILVNLLDESIGEAEKRGNGCGLMRLQRKCAAIPNILRRGFSQVFPWFIAI